MRSFTHTAIAVSGLTVVFALSTLSTTAQTSKAKPRPLATRPVLSGAEIISQAADYDGPIVTKTPSAVKTDDKVIDKTATPSAAARIKELTERINKLESAPKNEYDEKQKRMLLNLDILTRAEQRSESLRKQLFEMIEKESTLRNRMDQIDNESRPEIIERTLQLSGSMKPEEVRESRRRSLLAEKSSLQTLLVEIQSTRANLGSSLTKSEEMVEKLRGKLEKDIDDSFLKDDKPEN